MLFCFDTYNLYIPQDFHGVCVVFYTHLHSAKDPFVNDKNLNE